MEELRSPSNFNRSRDPQPTCSREGEFTVANRRHFDYGRGICSSEVSESRPERHPYLPVGAFSRLASGFIGSCPHGGDFDLEVPGVLAQTPAALHYPAVLAAAWIGGWVAGLLSTSACSLFTLFMIRPHLMSAPLDDMPGLIRVCMFAATSLLFVFLIAVLQRSLKKAARAIAIRDEFLSLASHELRTPLTSLKIHSDIFKRALRRQSSDVDRIAAARKFADASDRQVNRLNRLVSDMLSPSLLDSGQMQLDRASTELGEIVSSAVECIRPQAEDARCEIVFAGAEALVGNWDARKVEQVVANLLSNAIKYGSGKPVWIGTSRFGRFARLSVADQGSGIASKDLDRIFGRFERGVSYSEVQGLGLGLYLSKRIVELHDGTIRCESVEGEGSRFTIDLPLE